MDCSSAPASSVQNELSQNPYRPGGEKVGLLSPKAAYEDYGTDVGDEDSFSVNNSQVNSNTSDSSIFVTRKQLQKGMVGGAAVAGGVAGLVIAGPILGVVGAVGATVLCTQNSRAGDAARAAGGAVAVVGERAREIDEKHAMSESTKKAAGQMIRASRRFNARYKIVDNLLQGISTGLKFLTEKLKPLKAIKND
eukprot:178161_1